MSVEIEGIKALLDAHLTNIRGELGRLATNYDAITKTVQSIENNTNVAIAKIEKDISNIGIKVDGQEGEIKAIKQRIEINEDVQIEKWTKQESINTVAEKKDNRIVGLQLGAIGTFIALAVATIWNKLFP